MTPDERRAVDRRIIRLALPALGALAAEPVYVLVDTAIVGRLGTSELAGLAVAATVLAFVFAGANFLTYGTTERVARRIGAGDEAAAADVAVQAVWLAVAVGTPAAVALGVLARPIATVFGASGDVLDHAVTYLSISAVGVPFFLVTLAVQGVLRGVSDYVTPLYVLAVSNVANLIIELVMVFGLGMGVAGSAWSTVIAQVGAGFVFLAIAIRRMRRAPHRSPSLAGMAPLLVAGRHLLVRVASMLTVFGGATAVAARIDPPTLAAHQIVMSLMMFLTLTLDALAVPAQTIVAEALGSGDVRTAAGVAGRSMRLSARLGVALGGAAAVLAVPLPNLFTDDPAVAARATGGLWWLALALLPGAVAFAYDGVLIGAGDYRFLGRAALAYLVVMIPLGAAILRWPSVGISAIWAALTLWMLMRAVVNHRRTRHVLT